MQNVRFFILGLLYCSFAWGIQTSNQGGDVGLNCPQTGPGCEVMMYNCPPGKTGSCKNDECGVGHVTCTGPNVLDSLNANVEVSTELKLTLDGGDTGNGGLEGGYTCFGGALCTTGKNAVCLAPTAPNYDALYAQYCGIAKPKCANVRVKGDCYCKDTLSGPQISCYSCDGLCLTNNAPTVRITDQTLLSAIDFDLLANVASNKNCVGDSYCDSRQCYVNSHPLSLQYCSAKVFLKSDVVPEFASIPGHELPFVVAHDMKLSRFSADESITAPLSTSLPASEAVSLDSRQIARISSDIRNDAYVNVGVQGVQALSSSLSINQISMAANTNLVEANLQGGGGQTLSGAGCHGSSYCTDSVCYAPNAPESLRYCGGGLGVPACLNGKPEYADIEAHVCGKKVNPCKGIELPRGCGCKVTSSGSGPVTADISCDYKTAFEICKSSWKTKTSLHNPYAIPKKGVDNSGSFAYSDLSFCATKLNSKTFGKWKKRNHRLALKGINKENYKNYISKLPEVFLNNLNTVDGVLDVDDADEAQTGTTQRAISKVLPCNFIAPISCPFGFSTPVCSSSETGTVVSCAREGSNMQVNLTYKFTEKVETDIQKLLIRDVAAGPATADLAD